MVVLLLLPIKICLVVVFVVVVVLLKTLSNCVFLFFGFRDVIQRNGRILFFSLVRGESESKQYNQVCDHRE